MKRNMHIKVTRREVIAAAGAAATAALMGCTATNEQTPARPSRVSIIKVPAYDQSIYDVMRRVVGEHAGDVRGR
jgi:hypothetical protein